MSVAVRAFDTETELFSTGNVAPPMVCATTAQRTAAGIETTLDAHADGTLDGLLASLLAPTRDWLIVGHYINYDLSGAAARDPKLLPWIFQALAGPPEQRYRWAREKPGRVRDTLIREKLIHLSTHGRLRAQEQEDGSSSRLLYGLSDLEKAYFGRDRSVEKNGEDAWRKNYALLRDKPSSEWPDEAVSYPREDAEGTLLVYEAQEELVAKTGASLETEEFQVACDFALRLMTCRGWPIDLEAKAKLEVEVSEARRWDRFGALLKEGILREPIAPKTYKTGRVTQGKAESIDTKALKALVLKVLGEHDLPVKMTEKGLQETGEPELPADRAPLEYVCVDKEVRETVCGLHEALGEYHERKKLEKLATTEIPRMGVDGLVHPCFNVLVETGRTSSFAVEHYASANIQNVDPRARGCYVPPEGRVLLSVDYSSLEFCAMAQTCYELFGWSVMLDVLKAGIDPHAYLGAQLAAALDETFRAYCDRENATTPVQRYELFTALKKSDDDFDQKFFAHWRKFAKPVGFGFPGGLGAATFVSFAKGSYGVNVTVELALQLRELFFATYPEMREYFAWIQALCSDELNQGKYTYTSPFGMVRRGASFCAIANGRLLQTPAAEGAKLATFEVVRACYDPTYEDGEPSCLYGSIPLAFIHDEVILAVPEDEWLHERAYEVSGLMVGAMEYVMPDVPIKAEPKAMRVWSKDAETVLDENGRLCVWEPKAA